MEIFSIITYSFGHFVTYIFFKKLKISTSSLSNDCPQYFVDSP